MPFRPWYADLDRTITTMNRNLGRALERSPQSVSPLNDCPHTCKNCSLYINSIFCDQELQINCIDTEMLRAAQKNPGQYRDLVVRISDETGLVQQDVLNVVQKTLDYIAEAVAQGDRRARAERRDQGHRPDLIRSASG